MSAVEQLDEHEDIRHQLRVLTGGKGPPGPPSNYNWLSTLERWSVFACRQNDKTVDWEMYTLVHKFEDIYQLVWEMPNGHMFTRRVHPQLFSNLFRDYRLIDVCPPPDLKQEAPQGDDNGSAEQHHQV